MKTKFTLIELLIVVAIISVLAALLLPSLSRVREMARRCGCEANLKQIGVALTMYADDYGALPAVERSGLPYWWTSACPYLSGGATGGSYPSIPVLRCFVQTQKLARLLGAVRETRPCYGMNGYLGPDNSPDHSDYVRISQIPYPSGTLASSEAGFNSSTVVVTSNQYWITASAYDGGAIDSGGAYRQGVHDGRNEILWMDGHVQAWKDVQLLGQPPYSAGAASDVWRRGLP